MRFEHHQTRNPNSIFLRKLSVVGHNWKWIKQGFNLQRQECSNLTEHVPNSPGVRPVFRQNEPCLCPNFGQPRVGGWPALGLVRLGLGLPVVVRARRRSEGGDEEQGKQSNVEKKKKKEERETARGDPWLRSFLDTLPFFPLPLLVPHNYGPLINIIQIPGS